MASKPCSSLVVSLLAFVAAVACVSAGILFPPATTAPRERTCSIETGGVVRMFNQETFSLYLPCKYRLADFTCGDYRVKVTPGSAVDANYLYSPVTTWVKVVNTATQETVRLRTSLDRLQKAEVGTIDNVWQIKEGNSSFLDFAGYDGAAAVLEKEGVFTVQFSNNSVQVSCAAPDFFSPGVPETLCGDGSTTSEVWTAYQALFGNSTLPESSFVQYIVLNDTTVTQSDNCAAVASNFQGCDDKETAHEHCSKYLGDLSRVQCLVDIGTPPEVAYDYCLRKSCYGEKCNAPNLGTCTV